MTTAMPHARATVLPPQLTLAGDTLYAVQGAVYALDAASGSVLGHFASFTSEPVAVGDAIYINTNYIEEHALQALDPLTGVARWRYDISDRLSGAPVATERAILVGVAEGFVDAVDPGDGARLWRHAVGGLVFALPTVAEGVTYCAPAVNPPGQPTVFALRIDNGALLWRAAIPRSTTLPLIVSGGTVYIGAHDGCYALRAGDGALLWHRPWPSHTLSIHTPLALADGALFVVYQHFEHMWEPPDASRTIQHAGVLAFSAADGGMLWQQQLGAESGATRAGAVATGAGAVFVGSDDGYVNALRTGDGAPIWRVRLGELSFGAPVVTPNAVYIGASDGAVYALRPADGALLWRAFVSTAVTVVAATSITAMRVSAPTPTAPAASNAPAAPVEPDPSDPSGPIGSA
ncbi:MAG TPA: PQQ-binding-like beta-propeller repeat protein [Ktedonobacterales bacterium]